MYSMIETNVQQLVEVVLGAATMLMAVAGFDNLAGCECAPSILATNYSLLTTYYSLLTAHYAHSLLPTHH